jgi:type VI secretion system secreted protein VgrG
MRLIELYGDALDPSDFALSLQTKEYLYQEPGYELQMLSNDADLDIHALLGSSLTANIDLGNLMPRPINMCVIGVGDHGMLNEKYVYKIVLGSWLSFLEQNQNSRIFQNLSVPQIVEQVFQAHNRSDYRFELEQPYAPREYVVQFQESDLNFVKRLLQDVGIYFWIEHHDDKHVVVLSDTQRFDDLPAPYDALRFLPDGEESRPIEGREGVQRLQRDLNVRPTNVALRDFNYRTPSNPMDGVAEHAAQLAASPDLSGVPLEQYHYAAGYLNQEEGQQVAQLRMEAINAENNTLTGIANARDIAPGYAFTLTDHPAASRNRRYYVVQADTLFVQDGPDSSSKGRNVKVDFKAIPDDIPFRPQLDTLPPVVPGIQSATVVGPKLNEVHTDSLGRIRVHFHWDRYTTNEEDASCWIRVSQAWAGKGWGVIAMPRVGQEVLVTYIDGNLDRPLATGVVYNGELPTPYDLPADSRYSGLVSRSIGAAGTPVNSSQITFDDQRGSERVMIHAERDMQHTVERNASEAVGQDKNLDVIGTLTQLLNIKITYTNISISITGISVAFTGISVGFTGLDLTFTGSQVSFTGTATSFTGVSTSFTGVSTSFTGQSTSFTGQSTSFTGQATSYTGSSTSITGCSYSMTGISQSQTDVSISQTGQSTSYTGVSLSYVGESNSMTGQSTSVVGCSTSITGSSESKIGCSVSVTGSATSTTGSSTSMVGSSMATTGESTSMVGCSTSVTGCSKAVTGCSFSYTGVQYSEVGVDLKKVGMQIKS